MTVDIYLKHLYIEGHNDSDRKANMKTNQSKNITNSS